MFVSSILREVILLVLGDDKSSICLATRFLIRRRALQ